MLSKLNNITIPLLTKIKKILSAFFKDVSAILQQQPIKKIIIGIIISIFLLYYPLGALLTHNIKTDTTYEPQTQKLASNTIDSLSYLIYQEVYENTWTPSLPFIFPASILDNMPSFQKGVISAVQKTAAILAQTQKSVIASEDEHPLQKAASLLKYPPTIWMFSPTNQLIPAPSSNSQYRRARKHLQKYNNLLSDSRAIFSLTPEGLGLTLQTIGSNLFNTAINIENYSREHSGFIDTTSDEQFYFAQGQLFGYYIILKGISADYKNIIIDYNIYSQITAIQTALEKASLLKPLIIRNSDTQDIFGANHLFVISYYALKASALLQQVSSKLPHLNQQGNLL